MKRAEHLTILGVLAAFLLAICSAQAQETWECWQWSSGERVKPTAIGLAFYKLGITRLLGVHCAKANVQVSEWPCHDYYTKGNGTCVLPRDPTSPVYYREDGTPYQCGPMSYYGAICWIPTGVPRREVGLKKSGDRP
jgi:hypothetical protein